MLLSIIVPCYNEEAVLRSSHEHLVEALERLNDLKIEIIYVDDGSDDNTTDILNDLHKNDDRVRLLRLSRNFGHQIAVTAGLKNASGDVLVIIDADLQDPPDVIAQMLERWRDGYDVVYGVRSERPGESGFKLWTAKLFYRLINRVSETPIPHDTGDFRLMDKKVVRVLLSMPERDRFLRGMASWVGFRQIGLPYKRAPRLAGKSKYPLIKMIRFATDGIISFSFVPLRLVTWAGLASVCLSFAGIIYTVFLRLFTTDWVRGWASIFVAVLFLGGIQLISLGIIGEYLGRVYTEVKQRPLYVIEKQVGFDQKNPNEES